jgi:hypothetical protein
VAADFNRDGKVDVVTANATGGLVSLLLGDGSGGLSLTAATGTGLSPIDVVAGDLDRDGFRDLVVATSAGTGVELLKGTGTSFGTQLTFDTGSLPTRLGLGDFNRDGRPDLVVVSESANRVAVFAGNGTLGFGSVLANLLITGPVAAVAGDFNRDGNLDLAVVSRTSNQVAVYLGDGTGFLGNGAGSPTPFTTVDIGSGTSPYDLAAADLGRNGALDLVTANHGTGTATVLIGAGDGTFTPQAPVSVGGQPSRVKILDLDRDGVADLVVLDETPTAPRLVAFKGNATPPTFIDPTPYPVALPASSAPRGLAVADFTSDGRADLVTALSATSGLAVLPNVSGSSCVRSSFAAAPRSYALPNGPVSTAAADFDEDGRVDLAVATTNDGKVQIRRGLAGDFVAGAVLGPFSPPPRAVATADLNFDGHADLVVAFGDSFAVNPGSLGRVQVFLGDGLGGFTPGVSLPAGMNTSAIAIGDFDGNGAPDVAVLSEGNGGVWVFLGNGAGGLTPVTGNPVLLGLNAPRALVAADLTGDGLADLAIAESGGGTVRVLQSNGGGTFTSLATLPVAGAEGIAAADLDGDGRPDLVTAGGSGTVSVIRRTAAGGFLPVEPYTVGPNPNAVALVDLTGDLKPDIAVTSAGNRTVTVLVNNGSGLFPTSSDYPVRGFPRAITPLDADADGRLDLAVTCQTGSAVVVLLSRPPGPPLFAAAPRIGVGSRPHAVVAVDLDGDGALDLAVANKDSNTVSLLRNDGAGNFTNYRTLDVGAGPESIVAGDFNGDGRVDLAVNSPLAATKGVSILFGSKVTRGEFDPYVLVPVGSAPDDLAVGDFDRDGDLDIAVCDKVASPGYVRILTNDGLGHFSLGSSVAAGDNPTAIVAADFDRNGYLDLAVGNETLRTVQILTNNAGSFSLSQTLTLPGTDSNPLSLAVGDFDDSDGNDALDLAVAAFGGDRLHVYRNLGAGTFATTPSSFDAPYLLQSVTAADLNLDGRPDLLAVASGLSVFRGRGALGFEPPETVVTGRGPWATAVGDFNRDGWPDVAVVNETSNDVSVLLSTACRGRRLEVSLQPAACGTGLAPYERDAEVRVLDEGSNLASCTTGTVVPSIAGGDPLAQLGGPGLAGLPPTNGVASFTGSSFLTVDRPGRRYRLQFSLAPLPLAQTRSFTLGPNLQILGTPSVCPSSSATFSTEGSYDQYAWTLDPPATPFAFTPTATLANPPLGLGPHTLSVATRVDGCTASTSRSIYAGNLQSTTLAIQGLGTVCLDCIGGTIQPTDVGGGVPQSRQWGYRTASGGAVTGMPGETGDLYVLKGSSFPGPGTYYVVVTTVPTCGPPAVSSEIAVTVITSVPTGEVQYLAASSRGTSALGGQVGLQWVNSTGAADEVRVRWNRAQDNTSLCVPPPDTVSTVTDQVTITNPSAGVKDFLNQSGLVFDTAYCYSVFVRVGSVWSPGRTVKARPFNADTGPVKWAYSTGATAVVPPVVGVYGILAMSNDRALHSLTRGSVNGGYWPTSWVPRPLMGIVNSRSPVVPFKVPVGGADTILFTGDDAGYAQAVNALTGATVWGPFRPDANATITGAPGAILQQYGGVRDLILVPTRKNVSANPSALFGLGLADGSTVSSFDGGGTMGPVDGTPAIDYATNRVFVASRQLNAGDTVWCIQVNASDPALSPTPVWSRYVGDVDTSPVLRYDANGRGRVYVGNTTGTVYSLDAATGGDERTFSTGDGAVKGFLFPDRRNNGLIFATDTKVWSISDNGSATMTLNWQWTVAGLNPSIVLYRPESNNVYVGGGNGTLYQLEFVPDQAVPPTVKPPVVLGDGTGQVGAPSLDRIPPDVTPGKQLLIVGSESGVLYGVEVPF